MWDPSPVVLDGFSRCKHTTVYTLTNTVNLRCIQQRQRLMTRKTEIDFPPVTFSKSVTDSLTENNQKGDALKEVCECVEGRECRGRKVLSHSVPIPLIFPSSSFSKTCLHHAGCPATQSFPVVFRISSCRDHLDVRCKKEILKLAT